MANTIKNLLDRARPGFSLEQGFYTNPELYTAELEQIFASNWLFAGHVSQVDNPGDYFLFEMDGESVIVLRNKTGEIKAFANVCRHRGSRICLEPSGSLKLLRCPYHAWAYDLDGTLISASHMDEGFRQDDYALHSINLEILGGLIFVCLSDKPPSLTQAKADLTPVLELYGLADIKLAAQKSYPIAANWKLAVENYHECYHCGPAHPEYAQMHTLKLPDDAFEPLQTAMISRFEACGITHYVFDFQDNKARPGEQGYAFSRSALFEGYKTGSRDGAPLAPLLGQLKDYDGGASDLNIGPVSFFLIYSDHVMAYRFIPTGVKSCRCDVFWFVRSDAIDAQDYNRDELTWLWDVTTKADETIIEDNQKGIDSRFYKPGPFSQMEHWTQGFVDWYLQVMSNN